MATLHRRLSALEQRAQPGPLVRVFFGPLDEKPEEREARKEQARASAQKGDLLIFVEYVKDWRESEALQ